ncbi:hypothetical protein A6770_36660 [Nostoc minutum NIES-26]|uniref:Uncharacterized protein n=1 Tax=Nostoc minutum NIES-26 TaxID=1844469 RepID=A0A367RZ72_9NOSO|nr:hypothetical protein A6770_36660 [Nostoc minutum NIES-26]
MKKARLIKSGEFVQASEAKYDDHQGIYQCPHCKSALHLRKEYTRSDGIIVSAAFIHPSHVTEEQKNCPLRIQK